MSNPYHFHGIADWRVNMKTTDNDIYVYYDKVKPQKISDKHTVNNKLDVESREPSEKEAKIQTYLLGRKWK